MNGISSPRLCSAQSAQSEAVLRSWINCHQHPYNVAYHKASAIPPKRWSIYALAKRITGYKKKNVITHCLEKVHILRYSITIIIEKRSHPFIFDVCGRLPKMYKNSLHFFPGRGGRGPALSLGLDTDLIWLVGQWQMQHNQRLEKCLCPGACPLCPMGKPGPASWRGR